MKFFTTLLLATAAIAAPTSNTIRDPDSCLTKSTRVSPLKAHDFTFNYTISGSGNNKSYNSEASFTLENSALNYRAKCTGKSHSQSFFDGKLTYECNSGERADEATFSYDHNSGQLKINQDWNCAEDGARFSVIANTTAHLDCKTTKPKGKKSVVCSPKTLSVPITTLTGVA